MEVRRVRKRISRPGGFTLIELLVTVFLISILASAALPLAELTVQRNKEHDLRRALRDIREALNAYKQASDEGRIARNLGQSGYPPTLETLVEGVADAKDPAGAKIYFMRRLPRDPFFLDKQAPAVQTWGKRSYASSAANPQEGADVYDVYSTSSKSGLNGIPYREW